METRIHRKLGERKNFRAAIMEELDDDGNHVRFFSAILDKDGNIEETFFGPEGPEQARAYLENMDLGDDDDQDHEPPAPHSGPNLGM